jgi:hypothetical protein
MERDIDAPADDLRDDAARTERVAKVTDDPKKKSRLKKIIEDDRARAEAVDKENDVA